MFFFAVLGIQDKEEHLGTVNNAVCPGCGRLTRLDVYKAYRYLHIFFIPTFRWGARYFVKASCCGSLYELEGDVGRAFEHDPRTEIKSEHLRPVHGYSPYKYCRSCNAAVPPEYSFCPYCGGRL